MSDTNNDRSDIKEAAENADVQQINKNLENRKQTKSPELLIDSQKTAFINETVRTDK